MKYVSCWIRSAGGDACMMPVTPPMMNMLMKPNAYSMGVFQLIEPLNIVPIQLKILTPVGTAMVNDESMKKASTTVAVGVANMWCAQTSIPRKAMATVEAAMAL